MRRYGLPSKRAAVDLALRRLVGEAMSREEALSMDGTGWEGDLDGMRQNVLARHTGVVVRRHELPSP